MRQFPIPIHVGSKPPEEWDDIEARQKEFGEDAGPWLQKARRPALAENTVDWEALGFQPRWVGFDTAGCAVALQPNIFSGQGADEFDRFRQGAETRGETALVISLIGALAESETRNVFGPSDSIYLGQIHTSIGGRPLGTGAEVRAADGLGDADALLALRLLSCRPTLSWWTFSLHGVTDEAHHGTVQYPAQGSLDVNGQVAVPAGGQLRVPTLRSGFSWS